MKIIKILLFIIMYAFVFLIFNEGHAYIMYSNQYERMGYSQNLPFFAKAETFSSYYSKLDKDAFFEESLVGKEYQANPILLFGNSLANSDLLPKEQNFGSRISELTKRPVYNFARPTWGYSQMYYMLKNEDKLSSLANVDTIITVYDAEQFRSVYQFLFYPHQSYLNLKYEIIDGNLVEINPKFPFLYSSYYLKLFSHNKVLEKTKKYIGSEYENQLDIMHLIYCESMKLAKQKYPNLNKFIIFKFAPDKLSMHNLRLQQKYFKPLEVWSDFLNVGYTLIELSDVTDKEYFFDMKYRLADFSVNDELLDIIVPNFVEKAGL